MSSALLDFVLQHGPTFLFLNFLFMKEKTLHFVCVISLICGNFIL